MSEHKKGVHWRVILFAGIAFFIAFVAAFIILSGSGPYEPPKNSLIVHAINQARIVMSEIDRSDSNYDNFDCTHEYMIEWCEEIDGNYGQQDAKEPKIAHDTVENSQAVCIYSPLSIEKGWFRKENFWFCADSRGHAGYTSTDPGGSGYCVEGESAVCPPVFENIP